MVLVGNGIYFCWRNICLIILDEGHFQKLLDNEVQALKNACLEVYGNRPLPKITFVIIKKSHNTRFFAPNGQRITNMAAGTVIDTTIVHPRQFDFYLNSHAGALGTNVCSYYHVLYNEIDFTSDELQQLTFWVMKQSFFLKIKIKNELLALPY
jgi:eukaryotic translation initiation factor 2C